MERSDLKDKERGSFNAADFCTLAPAKRRLGLQEGKRFHFISLKLMKEKSSFCDYVCLCCSVLCGPKQIKRNLSITYIFKIEVLDLTIFSSF